MHIQKLLLINGALALSFSVYANDASQAGVEKNIQDSLEVCVMAAYRNGEDERTLAEIRQRCESSEDGETMIVEVKTDDGEIQPVKAGAISERFIRERRTEFDPYVITPHRINYILPAYTTNRINKEAYSSYGSFKDNLEDIESKFQLSLKVPLNFNDLLFPRDGLYFAFTIQAWWQIYSQGISKPFRETNYQPEFFYLTSTNWHPFGGNVGLMMGIEHQSNGRGPQLSRSWNRVYGNILFEKDNFALSLRPWVRLSEDKKVDEFDTKGDDNPDILDYMGHYELHMAYKADSVEYSFLGRRNFATDNGYAELAMTFPFWGKLRGYATISSGYGESLIDYNYSQTRVGIGLALNNIL
ncbi:phospholipase A [Colwellia sp. MEBiC06753]